ncbi:MAG: hypothetical protein HC815_05735 [Richelia sp. RM1_1_1]|nr:hypothetical protein [Richelia sp. RM1_1_1]
MIQTFLSGTISTIEEGVSEDGQLVCKGQFKFVSSEARENREEVRDELAFRCKGAPAMAIKESGVGATGVAQGYIDLQLVQMGDYKEKIPTLVVRVWDSTSIIQPNPFDEADAQLAQIQAEEAAAENPENAARPNKTFAF